MSWPELITRDRLNHVKGVRAIALVLAGLTLAAAEGAPQRQIPREMPHRVPSTSKHDASGGFPSYDGAFHFCRLSFRNGFSGDGDGWYVDYPRADENLSIRLAELTKAPVARDLEGNPDHLVVRLSDPVLFQCPFVMMSEPGGSSFDRDEASNLRAYLLKGGFLWADDFWGDLAWQNWETQIRKALPAAEFSIEDLTTDHPMFHTLFNIETLPQIPSLGLWVRYAQTSERGRESAQMHARAISDRNRRVIVFMTHNTDFGDAYEREAESHDYFQTFSINGYAIGIDVLLYAMTH
ncbi:MAG: DUF4159 domain-containing protein [Acidobacteria bacterium]|nr:DUF4159 domain-containing protein [Acidobacteriota bacterium]